MGPRKSSFSRSPAGRVNGISVAPPGLKTGKGGWQAAIKKSAREHLMTNSQCEKPHSWAENGVRLDESRRFDPRKNLF